LSLSQPFISYLKTQKKIQDILVQEGMQKNNIPNSYKIDKAGWCPKENQTYSMNMFLLDDDIIRLMKEHVVGVADEGKMWAKNHPDVAKAFFHPHTRVLPESASEFGFVPSAVVINLGASEEQEETGESHGLTKLKPSKLNEHL